jgi:hypothetical protein
VAAREELASVAWVDGDEGQSLVAGVAVDGLPMVAGVLMWTLTLVVLSPVALSPRV